MLCSNLSMCDGVDCVSLNKFHSNERIEIVQMSVPLAMDVFYIQSKKWKKDKILQPNIPLK